MAEIMLIRTLARTVIDVESRC